MRAMKDSGIEWIGSIPEHWEVKRLKNVADLNPTFNAQIEQDTLVAYMPMECLRNGIIQERIAPYSEVASYTPFKDGDVVMAKVTPCFENGNIAVATNLQGGYGFGTSEIFVIRCGKEAYNKYAFYYLQSAYIKNLGVSSMTGTGGLKRVNPTILNNSYFLSPSVAEQQAIADYLDEKCAEVDKMIGLQEQIIEELKAYKQSVITEAVTKGLNPAAPMRDSGIEWIGSIPEHWKLLRIKNILKEVHAITPTGEGEKLSVTQNRGIIKTAEIEVANPSLSTIGWKVVSENDIVFNKYKAHSGVFFVSPYNGIVTFNYSVYRCYDDYMPKFYEYVFKTVGCISEFRKEMRGVGESISPLYTKDLLSINIYAPPKSEQESIIKYLNIKCTEIDNLISIKQSKIDSLKEYKKSIIYEYVTGKREVE